MMTSSEIQEQLSANNPFFTGVAAEPWENDAPDISLNEEAYSDICKLISEVKQMPNANLAGLVLGEPGMGKTHLLKRILKYTGQQGIDAVFVSVRPFLTPQPMRHLLSEIIISLRKPRLQNDTQKDEKDVSQFKYFINRITEQYKKDGNLNIIHKSILYTFPEYYASRYWNRYFQQKCPGVSVNVLEAILHYYHDASKRNLVLNWLQGNIHEDFVYVLNFPDREFMKERKLEDEAYRIIISIGMLLNYCGILMVVCFDQLDGMREKVLINAFGDAVHVLVNNVKNTLPLAFVMWDTWINRFSQLNPAVKDRLSNNKPISELMRLHGCTLAEARELIEARITDKFNDSAPEKYQWLMSLLDRELKEGDSPREVINLANRAITGKNYEETDEEFDGIYLQERDKVARDLDAWPPNAAHMLITLEAYLQSIEEYSDIQVSIDKYAALVGKYQNLDESKIDCAFFINTAEHPMTVKASFERGVKFLQNNPTGRCYFISDGRCVLKDTWKNVYKAKEIFESYGGVTFFLTHELVVNWYGLTSLIFELQGGNITINSRTATEEDFKKYMIYEFKESIL